MNKTIYILWLQGFNNAPEIVRKCVKSWIYYNKDWKVVLLTEKNLNKYINLNSHIENILSNTEINKCHLADIIRVILLNKYGGVWADATTFCNKPLNTWLPEHSTQGFFVFEKPGKDRLISNWFIYSEKNNYVIKKWCEETINYYKKNKKAHTYFIHHYLFGNLYKKDLNFKKKWDNVKKLPANGIAPHFIQQNGCFKDINEIIMKDEIDTKIAGPQLKTSS